MSLLWCLVAAAAEPVPPVEVDVPPTEVTVFADRARVRRTGRVTLPRGTHRVAFVDLPPGLHEGSVTADVSSGAELVGVEVRRISAAEVADARVAELEDRLRALRDARQDREDDATAAGTRLAAVEAAREAAARQLSAQMLVATDAAGQARSLREALSAEDRAARDAVREAARAVRDLDEQIAALQRERQALGSSATDAFVAVVTLDVARAGPITVDLDYGISGARWRPRYDLRGNPATGEVALSLSAIVAQTTGEDWSGVRLAVSSARPGRGTDVPTLHPFWLQPIVPVAVRAEALGGVAGVAEMRVAEEAPAAPMMDAAPMAVAEAEVEVQLAATTFRVAGSEDVPSDGTERKVLLTTVDLDADLRHVAVPRLDPTVYLVGEVTNTAGFALLPGAVGVFVGGRYVGDTRLDVVPPGEAFDVSFGPDDRVTVARIREETTTGEAGPVGRRRSATWRWALEVASEHAVPVTVEIREQVPLSPRSDVEVRLLGDTPADDEGFVTFHLAVPARGRVEQTWGYTVTYPGDLTLGWME